MGFFKETKTRLGILERRVREVESLSYRPSADASEVLEALRNGIVYACESGELEKAALAIRALNEIDRMRGTNLLCAVVFDPSGERRAEQDAGDGEGAADKGPEQ